MKKVNRLSAIIVLLLLSIWALVPPASAKGGRQDMDCVPCDMLFTKLHESPTSASKRVQHVEMQLRGEPKSGTGMMQSWAWGAFYHTCDFLERLFGEGTCRVERNQPAKARSMMFEPGRGGEDSQCTCQGVESVVISLSKFGKHELPVNSACVWWHRNSIMDGFHEDSIACPTVDGRPVGNYSDVLRCMAETDCVITDDRPQLIVMRDPRPIAVSSYFHRKRFNNLRPKDKTIKDYIPEILPHLCVWITIRYILFTSMLSKQSTVYWYNDALADPLVWHYKYLDSIGLQLPASLVESMADAALRQEGPVQFKGRDVHSEMSQNEISPNRSWEDEVGEDLVEAMKGVVRVWLPPVLLVKLGIPLV